MMGTGAQESFDQLLAWQKAGIKPEATGWAGFPLYASDPFAVQHARIEAYFSELSKTKWFWEIKTSKLVSGKIILDLEQKEMTVFFRALIVRLLHWNVAKEERRRAGRAAGMSDLDALLESFRIQLPDCANSETTSSLDAVLNPTYLSGLIVELLRSQPAFNANDLTAIIQVISEGGQTHKFAHSQLGPIPPEAVMRALELFAGNSELPQTLVDQLEAWKLAIETAHRKSTENRELSLRLKKLIGGNEEIEIAPGEGWSNAALADLKKMVGKKRLAWICLLKHCQTAESSKPTKKWSKAAEELVKAVGRAEFKSRILNWFELVALPRPVHQENPEPRWQPEPDQLIADGNSVILKGMVWCCAGWEDKEVSRAVSRLAEVCFKKVRNLGARCPRIGNACFFSLSATVTEEAAAELTRLDQIVKGNSAKKLLGKSLDKAAELSGRTREDLEESTVPTYGLDAAGCLKQAIGNFTALYSITGPAAMELTWLKADGKPQKSVPAEVKDQHADEFKKLKQSIKDIEKMLPAQRHRLERLLMSEREWTFEKWRARYLDHPFLSHVARRLIWHFKDGEKAALGAWRNGGLVDVQDRPLTWLKADTRVRLWHPIGFAVETVAAWHHCLETHLIQQPFKQAHREIYILTDAELETETYSNRFAAHIIGQHQFAALAKQRGWKYSFMGGFDAYNTPTIELPAWGLSVEFWVEATGELAESGVSKYLSTDQVRFIRDQQPIQLRDVPAVVFTELMRDVDLFVGVCSIGNDPAWRDHGEAMGGDYWQNYSFGNLSATASTRRDVLERLLPKLKIASQCELKEKFLVVKGTLRQYKIHLGSGNILMAPNDQYLCIVADRGAAAKIDGSVFLPFEGDNMLSIILSKAFLLADDVKIKDASILSQIRVH